MLHIGTIEGNLSVGDKVTCSIDTVSHDLSIRFGCTSLFFLCKPTY